MRAWLVLAGLLVATAALAQLAGPIGSGTGPNFPAGPGFGPVGSLGGVNASSLPSTPCAVNGQLDFSDATGCNLVWAGH